MFLHMVGNEYFIAFIHLTAAFNHVLSKIHLNATDMTSGMIRVSLCTIMLLENHVSHFNANLIIKERRQWCTAYFTHDTRSYPGAVIAPPLWGASGL